MGTSPGSLTTRRHRIGPKLYGSYGWCPNPESLCLVCISIRTKWAPRRANAGGTKEFQVYGGTDLKIKPGSLPANGERRELFRFKPDVCQTVELPEGMNWYSAEVYATRDPDKSAFYQRIFYGHIVTAHFEMLNRNDFYYYEHTAGGPDVCNWEKGPNPKLNCIAMQCYDDSLSDSPTIVPMNTPQFKCAGQVNVRILANGKEFRIYRLTGDNVVMPDTARVWSHCAYGWMIQNVTEPPGVPGTKYMLFHPVPRIIDLPFYQAKVQYHGCAVSYDAPAVAMAGASLGPVHDASECARAAAAYDNRSFGIGKNSTCMISGSTDWMFRQGSVWTGDGCSELDMFGAPKSNGWNTAAIYSIDDDASFNNLKFVKPDTTPLPMPYMMAGTVKQLGCIAGVPPLFTVPLGQLGEPTNKWLACAVRATMIGFRSFLIAGNNECHGINAPNPDAFFYRQTGSFECNNPYNEAFPIGSGISSAVYEVDETAYNHLREYTQNGNNVFNPGNGFPAPYPVCLPYCLESGQIVPHRRYALADGSCFKTESECKNCLDSNGTPFPEDYDKFVSCDASSTKRDSRISNFPACKRANTGCVAKPPNYKYNQIVGTKYNMPNGMCLQAITDCSGCLDKFAGGDTSEEVMQAFEFCED